MTTVLFAAGEARFAHYEQPLLQAFSDLNVDLVTSADPAQVDYIIYAPGGDIDDFSPYSNAKAVLSLWAGVERIVTNATLTQPLCRMVDHGLREGMREWVCGHVLRHHLGMDVHIHGQDGVWRNGTVPPLARDRKVAVLGLGELGLACAEALHRLGFDLTGWSRSAKTHADLRCLHGDDGLRQTLTGAEIVVLLLPYTAQTDSLLNADRLALLASGAAVINPGRGQLIDDDALIAALDNGLGHATLDVFRVEPLPADHAFWSHPQITVTPHIASETRPETAAQVIAENVRRGEAGEPFLYEVDRSAGY